MPITVRGVAQITIIRASLIDARTEITLTGFTLVMFMRNRIAIVFRGLCLCIIYSGWSRHQPWIDSDRYDGHR